MGFSSLKPLNLILFDTYLIAILYMAFTWQYIGCNTNSNIWQLFFYLILFGRLVIDQLENNEAIRRMIYVILILITSVALVGMSIYELITIVNNAQSFDYNYYGCFQNRIILVGECAFGFLIFIKDLIVVICGSKNQENKNEQQ